MLRQVDELGAEEVHCSPLMTRPKDIDKRRVILDLSYPRGPPLMTIWIGTSLIRKTLL